VKLGGIRRGEEKLAFLLFSYFFLITTPHTIIKALRTTELLAKMGVGALPLAKWEHEYNYIRPHQSLDYLTPYQYYRQWKRDSRQKALPM
jgi:transposase InsO family protein